MADIRKIQKSQIDFNTVLELSQDSIMSRLNCHNIGRILEFDPLTQTCTVELMQIKQFNNQFLTPAPITQVPLIIYGAGTGNITLPDPTGSICLLLFMDRDISNFLETGEQYTPETTAMHDFSDCIALTTFKTLVNPIKNYDEKAVSIMNEEIIEEIKSNSYIKVYGNSIQLKVNVQSDEPQGAGISINDKVSISNTSQSLAPLIQAFITACENITTVADESGGGLTPASKQTFTDLKAQFEELLQ